VEAGKLTSDQYVYMTSCSRIPVHQEELKPEPRFFVAGVEELVQSKSSGRWSVTAASGRTPVAAS